MNVAFASAGRFHAFDLARQLHRLGVLARFYTAYPFWKVEGIPKAKVGSFPWLFAPMFLLNQHGGSGVSNQLNWVATETFDRYVAAHLEPCAAFHFLSSYGMHSQRIAKRRFGALTVCDHGSTHVVHQDEILAQEYARWGLPYQPPFGRRIIDRELQEYNEADCILLPSSFAQRTFVERGIPPEKLKVIPYGVDLATFRRVPKIDNIFRVIYVGMLNLRKGIPYLLEAVSSLRNLPNFEVWLVGSQSKESSQFLTKYAGCFRSFGYLPRDQLFRYYSQASVFVIASIEEGLATVQAQAMACGLPVIATRETGAEDLFTHGIEGFIVRSRDPRAIRERIMQLYEQPERGEEMGQAAMRRVESLEGWNSYGTLVLNNYRESKLRTAATVPSGKSGETCAYLS